MPGFCLTFKPVAFAALLPTLQSGQADLVISDIYATSPRAKAADFITYSKVFDGVLVVAGNPKHITGINTTMCGAAAAENTGFVEVPLVQNLEAPCKAAAKTGAHVAALRQQRATASRRSWPVAPTPTSTTSTPSIRLSRRIPSSSTKAVAVTLPYSVGIAVPKTNNELRDGIAAALGVLQKAGVEIDLLKKWSLGAGTQEEPRLVTN